MSLESKAAEVLLQKEIEVSVMGKTYKAAQPTMATLIMASEEIAKLPKIEAEEADEMTMVGLLRRAKEMNPIAKICAILILGAKRIRDARKHWWQVWRPKADLEATAEKLMYECQPREIGVLLVQLLTKMQLTDFFAVTVSLTTLNITKKTRETETTRRGQ